jgi:hypothetical protein
MFRLATFDQLHGTTTCRASRAHKPPLSRENPPHSPATYSRMIKYESMVWCCNATLFHALPRNCSDCFESSVYIGIQCACASCCCNSFYCCSTYIVVCYLLLQHTVLLVMHHINVLTATNIASKYLLLLELHLIHGKRHVDKNKSALRAFSFSTFTSVAAAVP